MPPLSDVCGVQQHVAEHTNTHTPLHRINHSRRNATGIKTFVSFLRDVYGVGGKTTIIYTARTQAILNCKDLLHKDNCSLNNVQRNSAKNQERGHTPTNLRENMVSNYEVDRKSFVLFRKSWVIFFSLSHKLCLCKQYNCCFFDNESADCGLIKVKVCTHSVKTSWKLWK